MKKMMFLFLSWVLISSTFIARAESTKRPNMVFILADDMSRDVAEELKKQLHARLTTLGDADPIATEKSLVTAEMK